MKNKGVKMEILILGASYGSLLSTKLLMAGHNVTLICRENTSNLINSKGTEVRIKLRDEIDHRAICSKDLPGKVTAVTPGNARPENYDMIGLAMQEPQYGEPSVRALMRNIAKSKKPCLSIMNMPPLPYLRRIKSLEHAGLDSCYTDVSIWEDFEPGLISLCSPDPQAFRPPEEMANVLHVGLPTNFKAAQFEKAEHNAILHQIEKDISNVRLNGKEVPVKLRVYESLFVPMAKWSMLLTGNYRCILPQGEKSIRDAVLSDINTSKELYSWVDALSRKLGADPEDQVPFEKYAHAAENLLKPSSGARAIASGAKKIERVDQLVKLIGQELGIQSNLVDAVVEVVDARLRINNKTQHEYSFMPLETQDQMNA